MIFGAAAVCAALLTWFLWASTKAPKSEKTVAVAAAARDMPAGTRLRKADIRLVQIPEKSVPPTAIRDERTALDKPLMYPVSMNETLTMSKVAGTGGMEGVASTIPQGMRAVAVSVADSSGASGLIQPRAHVDVLFTRSGSMAEAITNTILQDVVVLSVGRVTEAGAIDPKAARPTQQAVTLLVTPEQANKLELGRNQGKLSLALRNPLDRDTAAELQPVTSEALDPYLGRPNRFRTRASGGGPAPNLSDKAWANLTAQNLDDNGAPKKKPPVKEPPPKPRTVVDVYRGDKHVQETFQ